MRPRDFGPGRPGDARGGPPDRPPLHRPDPLLGDDAILLRPLRNTDAAAIAAACADAELARWIPIPVPYSLVDARSYILFSEDGWATGREATFAIVERATGRLAGTIAVRPAPQARGSVGYWLAAEARGRGLATRAVRLVAAWAFADPRLHRLELVTLVGNDASGRVALRAGFTREGVLRRYLRFRDRMVDVVMYSLVRGDLGSPG